MLSGFSEAFRVAGAAICLLLAAALLRDHPRDRSARASAFLLAGVVAHLLLPLAMKAGAPTRLLRVGLLLAVSVPVAFWLLAQIHFDDDFHLAPAHWVLLGVACGVGFLSWLAVVEQAIPGPWFTPSQRDLWEVAPKLLLLAIVVHALFRVYVGAGSDLLLPRLRMRYGLLVTAGIYMLIELLGELVFRGSPSERMADTLHSGLVLVIVFGAALVAVRTSPEVRRPVKASIRQHGVHDLGQERSRRVVVAIDRVFVHGSDTPGDTRTRGSKNAAIWFAVSCGRSIIGQWPPANSTLRRACLRM